MGSRIDRGKLEEKTRYLKENPKGVKEMCKVMEDLREESFAEGRAEGREEGRAEGREEGRAEGRAEGREEGRAEGREEGRAEGREEGRAEGWIEGRAEGREEGQEEGRREQAQMTARNLSVQGLSVDQIAQAVGFSVEAVKEWLAQKDV